MKTSEIIQCFIANDGRKVILRTPKWEDLDNFVELVNSLVDEGADVSIYQNVTREDEAEFLGRKLIALDRDSIFFLVAEVDGKTIGTAEIKTNKGRSSHVGEIGIVIKQGYRNVGIGTEMLKTLISQAKVIGLRLLKLDVYSTNESAINVYNKLGFKETGRIINGLFKNGKYLDDIIMIKQIE